jgi:thioesterase domain-containing protein
MLALINCYFPKAHTRFERLRIVIQRGKFHISQALERPAGDAVLYSMRKAKNQILALLRTLRLLRSRSVSSHAATRQQLDYRNGEVMRQYRPAFYAGHLTLMLASESGYTGVDPELDLRLAWRQLTPSADVYYFEGEHDLILCPPAVQRMAEVLSAELGSSRDGKGSLVGACEPSPKLALVTAGCLPRHFGIDRM